MMMVHERDRLQAIAAGWPCARYHLDTMMRNGAGLVAASIASYDRLDHGDRLKINHAVYDSRSIGSLLHALPLPSGGGCRMMSAQMAVPRGCLWSRERLSELCLSSCTSLHCSD